MVLTQEHDDSRRQVISDAIGASETQMPGAKDIRDVLEHFDDYELGDGRLSRGKVAPRDWAPTAESAAEYVIGAGLDENGLFVVRCGPHEIVVQKAAGAASELCRTIQRLTYVPAEHDAPRDFDPNDLSDPRVYAMAFFAMLSQLQEQTRPRTEVLDDLISLVAPETRAAWGDFTLAAQMVAGMGMGSYVDYDGEDIAYVKFVPDIGEAAVLRAPIVVPNGQVLTLHRRRDLPHEWYIYSLGVPTPASGPPVT